MAARRRGFLASLMASILRIDGRAERDGEHEVEAVVLELEAAVRRGDVRLVAPPVGVLEEQRDVLVERDRDLRDDHRLLDALVLVADPARVEAEGELPDFELGAARHVLLLPLEAPLVREVEGGEPVPLAPLAEERERPDL